MRPVILTIHAMSARSQRKGAFTLIELLIVITIIGILAVALIPRLTGGPARARDAQRKADLQQISTALEFYAQDNGSYPTGDFCVNDTDFVGYIDDYLTTMPSDPSDRRATLTDASPCTSTPYDYAYFGLNNGGGYLLIADLETETDKDTGVYMGGSSGFDVTITSKASENFTANASDLCSATTCTDAILVTGR